MATAPTAPATTTLDRNDGSATMELYRAVLGPVHTDKYLRAFTRFDAAGQTGISWNWSAALLTLNWMLFRRLWLPALAYAGCVAGALLLLLGIARLLFQLPDVSLWALAGLGLLLATVVPGTYGNAWLYAACNKAMDKALVASATLEEACGRLRKQSSSQSWLTGLAIGNAVLVAAIGALVWSGRSAMPSEKHEAVVPARSSQGLVQPAPLPQASAVASLASAVSAAASPVASAAVEPAAAQVPAKPSKAELQAQAVQARKERLERAREEKQAKAAKKAQEASAAKEAKEAQAAKAKPSAKPATAASAPVAPVAAAATPYLINVGLFADPNNARNAYTKLQDAGLPATIKELKSAKGPQTRVRAGPFDSEAEAERAADTIRGLHLDAVVIRP